MKAILEFTLPEDSSEYKLASSAPDFFLVLWDFDQWLRSEIKYNDKDYQGIRDKLHEVMYEHSICLDDFE